MLHQPPSTWLALLAAASASPEAAASLYADLAARYSEPHRHYHTLDHVSAVLACLRGLDARAVQQPALLFAVWYHDVIYDTRAADNEERSAQHARRQLQGVGVGEEVLAEMARLILLTRDHQTTADDGAGQLLLDADLSILGASPAKYNEYARAIRLEYAWVPDEQYRAGRAEVLRRFLNRPRLYWTERMLRQAEAAARANLAAELASLQGPRANEGGRSEDLPDTIVLPRKQE